MPGFRPLTKSRFKLGSECETKLFYTRKKEYADQSADNPFMMELAKGGYQVGELAKYYFYDDRPVPSIDTLDYQEALDQTNRLIDKGERYIAEAAIQVDNLFIRVDIFEMVPDKKLIRLYEVKAKSWNSEVEFLKVPKNGPDTGKRTLDNPWKPYLADVAFQTYVVSKAFPDYRIEPYLTLVNKDAVSSIDGLNQVFKIIGANSSFNIVSDPKLKREDLGNPVLINIPVDEEVEFILNEPVDSLVFPKFSFEDYISQLSEAYNDDVNLRTPISKACKGCQFYLKSNQVGGSLKSGMEECWMDKLQISSEQFQKPRVTEIWGGLAGAISTTQILMDIGKYFLEDVEIDDLPGKSKDSIGLSPFDRRWEQVSRIKEHNTSFYFDKEGFIEAMNGWNYPLHFIDFETSSPALPFTKNAHPYEGIAFQYSHHTLTLEKNGSYTIKHEPQFLNTDQGVNPNTKFIRSLYEDLSKDNGTIFRYHNHENAYLRMIYNQLDVLPESELDDKMELLDFIESITQYKVHKKKNVGPRNMVDMWDLVIKYYYSPQAEGSNSLKRILPAAIHDSAFLTKKYSQPICGKDKEISSRNFDAHVWIEPKWGNDPYKTLPGVFDDFTREELDDLFSEMPDIADGGAAMMAYAKLQFSDTPEDQRKAIRKALFKYCELDTLAMVMLMEFWMDEVNK